MTKIITSTMKTSYSLLGVMLVLFALHASAQPPQGPLARSPQVHSDKTVTFQYVAPNAKEVRVEGQFTKTPVEMKKGERGIWSVTVGPIQPDIYPYSFRVDGVTVMDPGNVDFFPNERFKGSLLDVPGDVPLIHAMKDVPHGAISYEYYPSVQGTTGSLVVYTPPGYDKNSSQKYPVFYLLSGTTDTEETWFKVGRVNLILDNLIAEGKAKPMIVVMPYGNMEARVAEQKGGLKPADPMGIESDEIKVRSKVLEEDLAKNVIPYIDKSYRTIANRENRAIAGFSRGGAQTLRTGFSNMDKFAWICAYSAYLSPQELEARYSEICGNPKKTNEQLKLLWVSVGDEDFLYKATVEYIDYLKAKKVNHKSLITSGGHTWMNTRKYLAETAQLLFK
jgi:enterochelin esterase-like enzyme